MVASSRWQRPRLNVNGGCPLVARTDRDTHGSLGGHGCFFDCFAGPSFVTSDKLKPSVHHYLRRVDTSIAKLRRVSTLSFTVFVRRKRILPSYVVPVVNVFAQHDELCATDGLKPFKLLQQGIGRRAARAAF